MKVKKNEFKKIEIKKIKEEMKTRMKEQLDERKKTQTCFFERDSVLKNTEEAKKDQKRKLNFSTFFFFFDRRNEKKRFFQKEENFVFVRMQGLFFEKKNI